MYALHFYITAFYVHVCTTLGLTHARSHANGVSGVDSTNLHETHPGVLSDSLTECHSECELCLFVLTSCTKLWTLFLPQVNCTSAPQTCLPPHLPLPFHLTIDMSSCHSLLWLPTLYIALYDNCPPFQAMPLSAESKIIPWTLYILRTHLHTTVICINRISVG